MRKEITRIINEELNFAEERIVARLEDLMMGGREQNAPRPVLPKPPVVGGAYADAGDRGSTERQPSPKPFPNPEKYQRALELYQEEKNHSRVARELGITINAAKKYYTWLVKNGYLPMEEAELSEAEQKVVRCIYEEGMSLTAAAKKLQCSVTNIVRRRDSAISKGYVPTVRDEK